MRVGKPDGNVRGEEQQFLASGFGARLRELREAAGLSRVRLAKLAGIAEMTVDFLEHGQRRPGKVTLAAMAAILSPQDPERVASELAALAGASLRPGWKNPSAPAKRGLTIKQARQALDQATATHDTARRVRRFRSNRATDVLLARAAADLEAARLDLQRAESLAEVAAVVKGKRGSNVS